MRSLTRSNDWMATGTHRGVLVQAAAATLDTIGSDTSLCIEVLDSVYGHEELVTAMTGRSWIEDVKFGRVGREFNEERVAIATYAVEEFTEFWPAMRSRLRDALLVSLVSNVENYALSLLVEFPPIPASVGLTSFDSSSRDELAWKEAEKALRKSVKSLKSTSLAWVELCRASPVPDAVKNDVSEWYRNDGAAIDEMILLRNSIVHRAGRACPRLAKRLKVKSDDLVKVNQEMWDRYRRASLGFLVSIDPSF